MAGRALLRLDTRLRVRLHRRRAPGLRRPGTDCTAYDASFALGGILGAGTALAGGLVGLLFETDRWERVPTGHVRVSVVSRPRRGVAVGVSFAF